MKIMITGSTNPLSIAHMWYEERIGEVFEVEADPKYDDLYITIHPIYKEHCGHIKKVDCVEVWGGLPQDIKTTESPSHGVTAAEEEVYGNDCKSGNCS